MPPLRPLPYTIVRCKAALLCNEQGQATYAIRQDGQGKNWGKYSIWVGPTDGPADMHGPLLIEEDEVTPRCFDSVEEAKAFVEKYYPGCEWKVQ